MQDLNPQPLLPPIPSPFGGSLKIKTIKKLEGRNISPHSRKKIWQSSSPLPLFLGIVKLVFPFQERRELFILLIFLLRVLSH
jgi:hypothetical protein